MRDARDIGIDDKGPTELIRKATSSVEELSQGVG